MRMAFCSTRSVICWRSATTSASTGGMRATTTCWLRKRDFPVSWRLRRGNCPGELVRPGAPAHRRRESRSLLSWSGSMFEYLMPLLVMPTYETPCSTRPIARRWPADRLWQKRGVPWGISESGYNAIDASQLPVPRLRRARAGAQARAGGGSGDRPLCLGAGADGGARGGLPESPATRRRALRTRYGFMRPSTTRRRVCRPDNRAPWCAPSWPITRA
jgi:hypothetical protein